MDALLTADGLVALATLAALEIVLGVDNIVFIAILTGRLPARQQAVARRIGLTLALGIRIGLLFTVSWLMGLTRPLFAVLGHPLTGRDLILIVGGLFLVGKATWEIYDKLEVEHVERERGSRGRFAAVIAQILVLSVMVAAMVIAMLVMLVSMGAVAGFIEHHPSVKILALAFLLLIGVVLVADGMGQHVSKAYIYIAMAFSLFVELLNLRYRTRRQPVRLRQRYERR